MIGSLLNSCKQHDLKRDEQSLKNLISYWMERTRTYLQTSHQDIDEPDLMEAL